MAAGVTGPLVVVVGETASGKSALALQLADRFNGELICADSRTVYRGMDIGTAKPTTDEQARVPHHCLDLVDPDQPFTVADFKQAADSAIADITARGRLPIMVGGTGLYIDAVLYDFAFRQLADPAERLRLSALSVNELQTEIRAKGWPMPENARNPRHLIRVLETGGQVAGRADLRPRTLIIGLRLDRDVLTARVQDRVDAMVAAGFIDEVARLGQQYGWDVPALQAPGYSAFREYLAGTLGLDEASALFAKNDLQLAKRQRTWFRRNNSVHWLDNRDNFAESVELVTSVLNN